MGGEVVTTITLEGEGMGVEKFVFPEIAARIPDYDPDASTDVCRDKARQIKVA